MFHPSRWAAAFTGVTGDNAETGLDCLKALAPAVKAVRGALFGRCAARRLEKMLRECVEVTGFGNATVGNKTAVGNDVAVEYAIRLIAMLVEKNLFGNIDHIMRKIEELVDRKKRVLDVTVESVSPLDGAFEEELKRQIALRTGAAEIRMSRRLVPELLGGYRLRFGRPAAGGPVAGFYIDASLKGQVEKLTADLEAAAVGN